MRSLAFCIVAMLLAPAPAEAGVTAYPSFYRARGADYYENLRAAKLAWLRSNAASVARDVAADRLLLAGRRGGARAAMRETIGRLGKQAVRIDSEIAVMRTTRDARQEALLKSNVEGWIGAARRGGDGAVAMRLMHDLAGTGL